MKKLLLLLAIVLAVYTADAQINFQQDLDWTEVLNKAKTQQKYIFIDCYATFCIPCREMDHTVFNQADVFNFLNDNFINLKIQFDSTGHDSPATIKQFAIARALEKKFGVKAFPTYLFLNPDGQVVAKELGAILAPGVFVKRAKSALNPDEQYYTLKQRYEQGDRSVQLIQKLVPDAVTLEDWGIARAAHNEFVKSLKAPYTKTQMIALYASISNSNSLGFSFLLNHRQLVDSILDDGGRAYLVLNSVLGGEAYNRFVKDHGEKVDWAKAKTFLASKAPALSDRMLLELKINLAHDKKDWEKFGELKMDYYDQYAAHFDHNSKFFMNNDLMEIFLKCSNIKTLQRAATWSKSTIYRVAGEESPSAMDTYANLLYKSGKVKEAISWQEKAVGIITRDKNSDASEYVSNLNKMRKGLPTWISTPTPDVKQ